MLYINVYNMLCRDETLDARLGIGYTVYVKE